MDQECCTSIDVGAQQTQPLVRRVPTFHDDVVQFISQEVFDHPFVAWIDFKEIGEHTGGSVSALQRARLKKAPHGLGGITMLGDDGFERSLLAERGCVFGTDGRRSARDPPRGQDPARSAAPWEPAAQDTARLAPCRGGSACTTPSRTRRQTPADSPGNAGQSSRSSRQIAERGPTSIWSPSASWRDRAHPAPCPPKLRPWASTAELLPGSLSAPIRS